MNAAIGRMLAYVPAGFDLAPYDVPALSLAGTGTATLSDLTFYVATGGTAKAIDLHGRLVSQVSAALPTGVTGTVIKDGPAELLLWPSAIGTIQAGPIPATLTIATSPLWQVLAVCARTFEVRRRNLRAAVPQINVRVAVGMWLDSWGARLGISRLSGEPDVLYAARLVGETLTPNVTNAAIEMFFETLGYQVSATDQAPGQMQVQVTYPLNPPDGFVYSQTQIVSILDRVKAAGVQAFVQFLAAFTDSFSVADAVTISNQGYMVADVSKAGACTCS